jgi:hypothetical protein
MRSSDYYVSPHTEEQRPRLPESLCRIVNARGAEGRHFSVTNAAGAIILPDPASTSTRRAQSVDSSGQDPVPSTERLPPIASQTQHIDTIDTRPQMLDRQHFPLPTSQPYLTKQSLTQSQTYQEFLKATSRDDARRLLRELVGHPPPSMAPWGDGGVSTSASPPHHHIEVSMDHPTSSPAKAEHRTFESRAFPGGSAMEGCRGEDDLGAYVMPKMRPRATHYWKWRYVTMSLLPRCKVLSFQNLEKTSCNL